MMRCMFNFYGCPFITVLESVDYCSKTNSLLLYGFCDSDPRYTVLDISREHAKFIMKALLQDGFYDLSLHSVVLCIDDDE